MAKQPSVTVNGYGVGDGPVYRIVWAETEGLLEATKETPWASFETFAGPGRNQGGDMDYSVRRLSIVLRISKQASFMGKHETLEKLSRIFSGKPAIVRVGSLYLEAEFAPVQVVKDDWKLTSGYLTVCFEGEAIPGTYFGEYGYQQGRDQGIIVQDDRPEHPSLLFTGSSFTVTNPGTAPTEAMVQVTNTSLPNSTVYLQGQEGQMMPVNLDATGYGRIDEAYGFLLYSGSNAVQLVNAAGSLITTGTFKVSFYGTRFRHIGNTGNRFADGQVLQHARTGSAAYVGLDGQLRMAGDGVARFGFAGPVVRRNLLAWSSDLTRGWPAWEKTGITVIKNAAKAPDGTATAHKLVLNNGAAADHTSCLTQVTGPVANQPWSVYAKAAGRNSFILQDSHGNVAVFDLATGTPISFGSFPPTVNMVPAGDGWFRCELKFPADATGNVWYQYITGSGHGNGIDGIFLWMPQVDAGSTVTPPQPTNATGVDHSHPLNGAGLVLEGASTNLLSPHAANCWDDSNEDITPVGEATLFRDPVPYQGSGSLKVVCSNTNNFVGARFHAKPGIPMMVAPGDSVTAQCVVQVAPGCQIVIAISSGPWLAYSQAMGATGNVWTPMSATWRNETGSDVQVFLEVAQLNSPVPSIFYVDAAKLAKVPFPTSWTPGSETTHGDRVGIAPPHNLLNWSEDFSKWSKLSASANGAKLTKHPAGYHAHFYQDFIAESDGARALSVKLKADTLSKGTLRVINVTTNTDLTGFHTYVLTGEYLRYAIQTGNGISSGDTVRVYVYPGDPNQGAAGSIFGTQAQMTEGSHPGIYVPTTDTPSLPPPNPALDPALSQNCRIKIRILPPPISAGKSYSLFGLSLGDAFALTRYEAFNTSQPQITFDRIHNGGNGGRGFLEPPYAAFWDGAPHDVELEWTNEISEATGIREMWMRIYIDGQLLAERDVAALYGATEWAPIDPSRFISGGNVFAVLCGPKKGVIIDFPTPRAGYRWAGPA